MSAPTPARVRQARRRAGLAAAGGRQLTVGLDAVARAKLDAWLASGATATAVVNRLLARSRPPVQDPPR